MQRTTRSKYTRVNSIEVGPSAIDIHFVTGRVMEVGVKRSKELLNSVHK